VTAVYTLCRRRVAIADHGLIRNRWVVGAYTSRVRRVAIPQLRGPDGLPGFLLYY